MKARLVEETINFKKTGDPLTSMGLGGLSFDTLNSGAILQATRFFGVTNTGTLGGISRAFKVNRDSYFLVTRIEPGRKPNTKLISWVKTMHKDKIDEAKERFLEGGSVALPVFGLARGFFDDISKRKFDYRLKVIERGSPTNESYFRRGKDPKKALGIGKTMWENLDRGDVLKPKIEFKMIGGQFEKALHFAPPSTKAAVTYYEEDYLVVEKVEHDVVVATSRKRNPVNKVGMRVKFYRCWDMDQVNEFLREIEADSGFLGKQKPVEGTIEQFDRRLEILQNI